MSYSIESLTKDKDEILDFKVDFSAELNNTGSVILSKSIIMEDGITEEASSNDSNSVTIWISGGTTGERYLVTCRITDNASPNARIYDRSFYLHIVQK